MLKKSFSGMGNSNNLLFGTLKTIDMEDLMLELLLALGFLSFREIMI